MVLGDPLVTPTKGAKAFTVRQVDIKTDTLFEVAFAERAACRAVPLLNREGRFIPIGNRRIARVSWPRYVVLGNQSAVHGRHKMNFVPTGIFPIG